MQFLPALILYSPNRSNSFIYSQDMIFTLSKSFWKYEFENMTENIYLIKYAFVYYVMKYFQPNI